MRAGCRNSVGNESALGCALHSVQACIDAAVTDLSRICCICCALAGVDTDEDAAWWHSHISKKFGQVCRKHSPPMPQHKGTVRSACATRPTKHRLPTFLHAPSETPNLNFDMMTLQYSHLIPSGRSMQDVGLSCTVLVCNDAVAVLAAGAGVDLSGIALVAGTGCIAVGGCAERFARAGGWGPAFGDSGGGLWIGQQALQHVAASHDAGCRDELCADVMRAAGADSAAALLRWAYADASWSHIASLAPAVFECSSRAAMTGSDVAKRIVTEAAHGAAAHAMQVHARVSWATAGSARVRLVLAGGLTADKTSCYCAALSDALERCLPGCELHWCAHASCACHLLSLNNPVEALCACLGAQHLLPMHAQTNLPMTRADFPRPAAWHVNTQSFAKPLHTWLQTSTKPMGAGYRTAQALRKPLVQQGWPSCKCSEASS